MATRSMGAPIWFRLVTVLLLLWGLMGCYACLLQFRFGAEAMGPASDYDRGLHASLPVWYNWVYAIAVGSGTAGALALLLRSAVARPLFVASLVACVVMFGWLFATTDLIAVKGAGAVLPFPMLVIAIAAFALWLSGVAIRRGWIA